MKKLISKKYSGQRILLNPDHPYTNSASTNIADTFLRVKYQMQHKEKIYGMNFNKLP